MTIFDAVIVGAGPAGAAAAYDLARAGARILILDKENFPRDKPCGGGLTVKTVNALRFDVRGVICQQCDRISLTNRLKQPVKAVVPDIILSMTTRRHFDKFCLDRAIEAGAEFSVARITDVLENAKSRVTLRTVEGTKIVARFVIAADGAKSAIRRIILPENKLVYAFALEGKVAVPKAYDRRCMDFDFFVLNRGYGWIFPKNDHLNIGIGGFSGKGKHKKNLSKKNLLDYCREKCGHTDIYDIVGHPLGGGGYAAIISEGRVLFAGDAAGTVESLLGEGLYNAVISGQIAASAILKAIKQENDPLVCRDSYEQNFKKIRKELSFCLWMGKIFYGFPALSYPFLRFLPVQRKVMRGMAEGKTIKEIMLHYGKKEENFK